MSTEPDTQAPGKPTIAFRPDIQGIRALAVGLVFLNHLAPGLLTGGYIGVDVFFVVSGYLITSLLLREEARTERISLVGFYARRARRILPAATVVTVVTVVASLLTLSLIRVQTIITDAIYATLFAANIRMAQVGTDYFAQGEPPSPMRHYWSLSVEEQFYLVWPALLLLCLVLARRRTGDAAGFRRWAAALITVVIIGSLLWSVWATYHSPVTAYYSFFTRAWELGIGALCAFVPRGLRLSRPVREVLGVAGIAAIGGTAMLFTLSTPFPSAWAAVPVLGTAALILAGENAARGARTSVVGRLLSIPALVVIGDWSYSIYLWHWPVIVLVRSNIGPARFDSIAVRLAIIAAVLLLSWASYRWIETPFRKGSTWRRASRALLIYPASIGLVAVVAVVSTVVVRYELGSFSHEPPITTADYNQKKLGKDPYVALVRASVLAAKQGRPVPSDLTPGLLDLREQTASLGDCDYRTGTTKLCPIGDVDADRTIVLLGDSHARALAPAIEKIGSDHGYRVYVLVYSGCTATSLEQIDRYTGRLWDDCEHFKDWAEETIPTLDPDLIVVSTSAGRVIDPETGEVLSARTGAAHYNATLRDGWRDLFETLGQSGRVVVVGNTPKLPREPGVCLTTGHPDLAGCTFPPGPQTQDEARASFEAAQEAGAGTVDAMKWFCAADRCPPVVGHFITMRDSEHVTPDYARWLAPALAAEMGIGDRPATASGS